MSKQLEQLYFTWSKFGYGDTTGLRLRSASPGLTDINATIFNNLKPYLNYVLPKGTDPYKATTEQSPFCLVYAKTDDKTGDKTDDKTDDKYILAQKVYTGKDAYDRTGAYFIHLLSELPENFVARDAIRLWRQSSFWRYWKVADDKGQDIRLPPINFENFKAQYCGEQKKAYSQNRDFLKRVIQAYFLLKEEQKLYIAGTADQVAELIQVLTYSLPDTMQRDLTFSTYEQDVLKATMRVVGTCTPQTEQLKGYIMPTQLLPTECYSRGLVIDCYKQSVDLQDVSEDLADYSTYVIDCLLGGTREKKELDEFLRTASKEEVKDAGTLIFSYVSEDKFVGKKQLSKDDIIVCLENLDNPRYLKYLYKDKVQQKIIESSIRDPKWWHNKAAPIIQRAYPKAALLAAFNAFGKRVALECFDAMIGHQAEAAQMLRSILLTVTPPDRDTTPWVLFLRCSLAQKKRVKGYYPYNEFGWEICFWLLSQCAIAYWTYDHEKKAHAQEAPPQPLKNEPIEDELISPWLQVSWDAFWKVFEQKVAEQREKKKTAKNYKKEPQDPDAIEEGTFPIGWLRLAFMDLLLRSKEETLPKQIMVLFDLDGGFYPAFMGALMVMMWPQASGDETRTHFEQRQQGALRCFRKLAQGNYPNIPLVLTTLLGAGPVSDALEQEFFAAARLDPTKKVELLENYYEQLVPFNSQGQVSAVVTAIIDEYVTGLTLGKLAGKGYDAYYWKHQTLAYLCSQQHKLPESLRTKVIHWAFVSASIYWKNLDMAPLTMESDNLTTIGEAIRGLQLVKDKHYEAYKQGLFSRLIDDIKTNDDLRLVLASLAPALTQGSQDVLLQELAAHRGKMYTAKDRYTKLMPYIVVTLYHSSRQVEAADPAAQVVFVALILDPLLQHVHPKTLDRIDAEIAAWSDQYQSYKQSWNWYRTQPKQRRKSLRQYAGEVVQIAGGVAQNVGEAAKGIVGGAASGLPLRADQSANQSPQPTPPSQEEEADKNGTYEAGSSSYNAENGAQGTYQHGNASQTGHNGNGLPPMTTPEALLESLIPNEQDDTNFQQAQNRSHGTPEQQTGGFAPDAASAPDPRKPTRPLTMHEKSQLDSAGSLSGANPPSPLEHQHVSPNALSMVKGYPITAEQVQRFYDLKDIYIEPRLAEIGQQIERERRRGDADAVTLHRLSDERDELADLHDSIYSWRVLENDVLILYAIKQFMEETRDPQLAVNLLVAPVLRQVKRQWNAFQKGEQRYTEDDLLQVLLVFLRYRTLADFFQRQGATVSMGEWLEKQRALAEMQGNLIKLSTLGKEE